VKAFAAKRGMKIQALAEQAFKLLLDGTKKPL
jgi:hypothetical protein